MKSLIDKEKSKEDKNKLISKLILEKPEFLTTFLDLFYGVGLDFFKKNNST